MNSSDVSVTLKDMWTTRPTRPRADRKIAGVGSALARRYDLDPVLVRVGLVAAAFTGVGLAFYVLAWCLLPGEAADGSVPDRRRPQLGALIVLGILAVIAVGDLADNPLSRLLPAAALAVLLFLLHRSRADRGIPGPATAAVPSDAMPVGGSDPSPDRATPPAWDPLGAAPFAWDLPEPAPAAVPARPRSRVTPITLATALLAGGVAALVLLASGGLTDLPVLLGVVLSVLGGGLLVGSFVRSGRGLIPFALLAVAVTWGALAAPLDQIAAGPAEDLSLAPSTPAALASRYETGLGSVDLDLRRMDLTVPPGAAATPVATTINAGVGDVEIRVPRDADVRFTGESGLGSVEFDGQERDGPGAELSVNDLGADGVASGRPIVLDVHAGAGSVVVNRG